RGPGVSCQTNVGEGMGVIDSPGPVWSNFPASSFIATGCPVSETKDPVAPLLIVTGGPLDGSELAFTRHGEKTLGASPECDLKLELGNVDPLHAGISWDAQGLVLTDMSSSTGTYVNGEKISGDHTLADGDRVCLGPPGSKGSVKLLVRVPESALGGAGQE